MHPVTSLTIVYDASCRLCTRLKVWTGRQPSVMSAVRCQWLGRSADEVSGSVLRRARCSCRDGGRRGSAIMPGLPGCGRCETTATLPTG